VQKEGPKSRFSAVRFGTELLNQTILAGPRCIDLGAKSH
jgi:hypothetical protein